jgi:hypothetical protein
MRAVGGLSGVRDPEAAGGGGGAGRARVFVSFRFVWAVPRRKTRAKREPLDR